MKLMKRNPYWHPSRDDRRTIGSAQFCLLFISRVGCCTSHLFAVLRVSARSADPHPRVNTPSTATRTTTADSTPQQCASATGEKRMG